MINRRHFLAGTAGFAAGASFALPALAEDIKELVLAAVPDENATGTEKRYEGFVNYLSKEVGIPVKLRIANDYAAVIEGQIAGNIHIAQYGPAPMPAPT